MPRNQIVMNIDVGETRVALIENGIVGELHIERRGDKSVVGDVYLGRVTRVLPGMNAAFVDIGLERAAFLHLEDVVSEGDLRASEPDDNGDSRAPDEDRETAGAQDASEDADESGAEETDEDDVLTDPPAAAAPSGDADSAPDVDEGDATVADLLSDADENKPAKSPADRSRDQGRRGRGGQQGRGDRFKRRKDIRGSSAPHGGRPREGERGAPRGPQKSIRDVLREGQDIVVQVSKGPISTKGARCTSHISLPGRYAVYMPTVEQVGVSKRIGNERERKRLREVVEQLKPDKGGLIVRTASEGLTKKQLKNDVAYLVQLWGDIWRKRETAKAPALLYSELDVVLRTVRDVMGPDIEKIVIDDKEAHSRCVRFVEQFMPDRKDDVTLYSGTEPVFDEYGIEDEIARALARKVPLKSGGYLIIDEAEALTAIDVNSGRFVGKRDVEDTVTQTNIEAVAEIAYQLRLRNLGGLIILDLIDMDRHGNRDKVYKALAEALKHDKAKTSILRISELGLIEMTRKRTRESLGRQLYEPCFYCDGTGHTQSKLTIAYEIVRQIRRERDQLPGYNIIIEMHTLAVADTLKHMKRVRFLKKPNDATCAGSWSSRNQSIISNSSTCRGSDHGASWARRGRARRVEERVTINQEFESFDAFIDEYVTNISRSGAFIKCKAPFAVGTKVNLRVTVIADDIATVDGVGEGSCVCKTIHPGWVWYSRRYPDQSRTWPDCTRSSRSGAHDDHLGAIHHSATRCDGQRRSARFITPWSAARKCARLASQKSLVCCRVSDDALGTELERRRRARGKTPSRRPCADDELEAMNQARRARLRDRPLSKAYAVLEMCTECVSRRDRPRISRASPAVPSRSPHRRRRAAQECNRARGVAYRFVLGTPRAVRTTLALQPTVTRLVGTRSAKSFTSTSQVLQIPSRASDSAPSPRARS